jgi:2-keto-4-pentenoate hydratase/2-oxohepta-3-ene-1,7-dioic acid hydratase in catechol pathway
LVSYRIGEQPARAGVIDADAVVRALPPQWGAVSLLELVEDWAAVNAQLLMLAPEELERVANAVLDLPMRFPAKMIFAGANYFAHAEEMQTPVPEGTKPYFFFKPPTTTLVRDGDPVAIDADQARIDWEAELGVVIGQRCRGLTSTNAMDAVAGYVVINDITDRARLRRQPPVLGPQFAFDWLSAKALDSSCPISSVLVPAALVANPQDLGIRLWVNETLQQDGVTSDMVADVPTLLAAITEILTLEPGDIVATGTPAGVGVARDIFLRPGDRVTAEVQGVGRVTNTIVLAESTDLPGGESPDLVESNPGRGR